MEWCVELTTVFINIRRGCAGFGGSGGEKRFSSPSTPGIVLHEAREGFVCTAVDCMLNNHSSLFFSPGEGWIARSQNNAHTEPST